MELEEMKGLWNELSQKIDSQKVLTDKLIIQMTKQRYTNKLKSISIPESIGTVVCFAAAAYILNDFDKLNAWYLQLSGIIVITFCMVLPVLSLRSIKKMRNIDIAGNTYKESLIEFEKNKNRFMLIQKLSYNLSFFLILVTIPVMAKLMKDIDIFQGSATWVWFAPIGLPVLYLFARWVYKNYKNTAASAEDILKELEN